MITTIYNQQAPDLEPPRLGIHQRGVQLDLRRCPGTSVVWASVLGNPVGLGWEILSGWWLGHPSEKYESQLG